MEPETTQICAHLSLLWLILPFGGSETVSSNSSGWKAYFASLRQNLSMRSNPFSMLDRLVA